MSMDSRVRLIQLLRSYSPEPSRPSMQAIESNHNLPLLDLLNISHNEGHELIEAIEDEFDIKTPIEIAPEKLETLWDYWRLLLDKKGLIRSKNRERKLHLQVPQDITLDTLIPIIESGFWPIDFYCEE